MTTHDAAADGMTLLERRYRGVLRLLPATYRERREEEMVEVFLSGLTGAEDEEYSWPAPAEVASVVLLAVRLRTGLLLARLAGRAEGSPSPVRGETARLLALLGLLGLAVLSAWFVVVEMTYVDRVQNGPHAVDIIGATYGPPGSATMWWHLALSLLGAAWLPAYVELVLGRLRAAKVFALLAVVPLLVGMARSAYEVVDSYLRDGVPTPPLTNSYSLAMLLLVGMTLLALFVGFPPGSAPVWRLPWLGALPAGLVLLVSAALLTALPAFADFSGAYAWLVGGAALAYGGVCRFAPHLRTPAWPLAVALLSVPAFTLQLAELDLYRQMLADPVARPSFFLNAVQIGVVLVAGAAMGVTGRYELRRLSALSPPDGPGTGVPRAGGTPRTR